MLFIMIELQTDLSNLCVSYLTFEEIIYSEGDWTKFNKFNVNEIGSRNGWLDLLEWAKCNKYTYHTNKIYEYAAKNGSYI